MFKFSLFLTAATASKDCHAVPGTAASDDWCNSNCNFTPPNCPTSLCTCSDGPTPRPTPTPTPSPSPTPAGKVLGYWDWTWEASGAPSGATFGVAFNGWADPSQALSDSEDVYSSLVGEKYISIGGGNNNGRFTRSKLQALVTSINSGNFEKYDGIALDVEECDSGLETEFTQALAAAKAKGMKTMVTISHSAPYGCDDAKQLMQVFFADGNTDYLSPQMYTSGEEQKPDFEETTGAGVSFDEYTKSRAAIIPSIVDETHYAAVQNFFQAKGVSCEGYVQWAHARAASAPVASPAVVNAVLGYWDWTWEVSGAPSGATFGVAFNGWADPSQALSDSEDVYSSLVGDKYISIGGGNNNGRFTRSKLQALVTSINSGNFEKYDGIALDVEECDSGLETEFTQALAAAKAKGMKTMVTISHSAPYGCDDAKQLMQLFFADGNTDYLSPQMYTSGEEQTPDFDETTDAGVSFDEYTKSRAAIIPSIVDETHYAAVKDFFQAKGVSCVGYVQWAHAHASAIVA